MKKNGAKFREICYNQLTRLKSSGTSGREDLQGQSVDLPDPGELLCRGACGRFASIGGNEMKQSYKKWILFHAVGDGATLPKSNTDFFDRYDLPVSDGRSHS